MPTKIDFIGGNTKRCLMAMALPMIAAMILLLSWLIWFGVCYYYNIILVELLKILIVVLANWSLSVYGKNK